MLEQDQHLDHLSHSINRQHHISLQINDELDVHHGLLQDLDADIDRTQSRLGKARKKLDRVARGVKNNGWCLSCCYGLHTPETGFFNLGSVVAIGVLIFILLILIIRFKT